MSIDHRPDEQLFEQNQENLYILENLEKIKFLPVQSVTQEKYTGTVYDLEIEKVKNYQTEIGIVHNGGKRPGSLCVYLDTWHPDIMEFLELRDNTGDKERRTHNLNLANWIPDLFMKRVKEDAEWSLIDPSVAPELVDLFGPAFETRYLELEAEGKVVRKEPARKIYARMMRTLAETGNGWMCWKDRCNIACNIATNGRKISSSNLCLAPNSLIRAKIDGEELDVTISILTEKFKRGSEILVYTLNEIQNTYEWQHINNVGITDQNAELIEIDVDGTKIECTENHLFLTKNRGWVDAISLLEDDELVLPNLSAVDKLEEFIMTK